GCRPTTRRTAVRRRPRRSRTYPAGCPGCRCRSRTRRSSARTWSGRAAPAGGTPARWPTRAPGWRWPAVPAGPIRGYAPRPPACRRRPAGSRRRRARSGRVPARGRTASPGPPGRCPRRPPGRRGARPPRGPGCSAASAAPPPGASPGRCGRCRAGPAPATPAGRSATVAVRQPRRPCPDSMPPSGQVAGPRTSPRGRTSGVTALTNLRRALARTRLAPLVAFPKRAARVARHDARVVGASVRWLFTSREHTNYTYDLTTLNRTHLAWYVAAVCDVPVASVRDWFAELEGDEELRGHILATTATAARRGLADRAVRYGRRLGWYAMVRARRPAHVVE